MATNSGSKGEHIKVKKREKDEGRGLTAWPPARLGRWVEDMRRDVESWMGTSFGWPRFGSLLGDWQMPRTDIVDAGDHYELTADVPGIPKDKIEVSASDGRVDVRAEATTQEEEEGKNYYHREIGRRAYYRSLPLPDDADVEHAQASLDDGCLTITVPKKPEGVKGKRIPLK